MDQLMKPEWFPPSDILLAGVGEAVRWGVLRLQSGGVESPQLTAQLLLGHVLGWERVRIIGHPEEPLLPAAAARYADLIRRRAAGEPLQYLTGTQEFFGRAFEVSPAVLIPRPSTELLVERTLALCRGRDSARIADVGTGSGCIAVSIACEFAGATVTATDISGDALAVARRNTLRHGAEGRIAFVQCDLLEGLGPRPLFDLVLSNPPYVAEREAHALPQVVHAHEPHLALFGGSGGVEFYERLVPQALPRLFPRGHLILELGFGQASAVCGIVSRLGLEVMDTLPDLEGVPRCLVARRTDG